MIKAILFDLDGVLVDACEIHRIALNRALQTLCACEINHDEHMTAFNGLPTRTKLNLLWEQGRIKQCDFEAIWQLKQEITKKTIRDVLKHDTRNMLMLESFRNDGYKLGCVTNSIRETTRLMLTCTGQLQYMDVIISNQDVNDPKPHPEAYIRAMIALAVMPEFVLAIEDSEKGQQAARMSGAHVMAVLNTTHVTLDSIKEAIRLIEE